MMRRYILLGTAVLSLALARSAGAGQITNLQLYDGTSASPVVTVNYTSADGTGSNAAATYADPQVSSGTTLPMFYCTDLWHDNYLGSSYTITSVASMAFGTSTFSDVDNRIGWLLTQDQGTVDARAATQLAIWYTVDNVRNAKLAGFSFTGGDSTLRSGYNQLIGFSGYNPSVQYAADFWQATHDPSDTLYQNLVSATEPSGQASSTPEPSGIVLAGIGMLCLIGAGRLRSLVRGQWFVVRNQRDSSYPFRERPLPILAHSEPWTG
jgi:hypothetical protein